jgi:hypothetical protein
MRFDNETKPKLRDTLLMLVASGEKGGLRKVYYYVPGMKRSMKPNQSHRQILSDFLRDAFGAKG